MIPMLAALQLVLVATAVTYCIPATSSDDEATEDEQATVTLQIGYRTDVGVVIDKHGTVWDGHIEVTHSHDPSVTPVVTIRTPSLGGDPKGLCELEIESTDDSVGPTDLVHTTKYVPFGVCGTDLWMAHFIISGRGDWLKMHLHVEGEEDFVSQAYLVPETSFAVGANTATIYKASTGLNSEADGTFAFPACERLMDANDL
ncbi:hypothetical protein HOI83_04635 [Candidatus Uhrbacteria bacterium]|nr:hypothetical protein [Candidatus Uhrbacteria bacterium]